MNEEKQHHVAWRDRLGLNEQWMRDIQACSAAHGTEEYINQIDRFRNDIINIKNGPPLYDIITKEWKEDITGIGNKLFDEWISIYPQESKIDEERDEAMNRIRLFQAERLYHFILQTLEQYGFGFYQSMMEEDQIS